jgi:hypothetical protein
MFHSSTDWVGKNVLVIKGCSRKLCHDFFFLVITRLFPATTELMAVSCPCAPPNPQIIMPLSPNVDTCAGCSYSSLLTRVLPDDTSVPSADWWKWTTGIFFQGNLWTFAFENINLYMTTRESSMPKGGLGFQCVWPWRKCFVLLFLLLLHSTVKAAAAKLILQVDGLKVQWNSAFQQTNTGMLDFEKGPYLHFLHYRCVSLGWGLISERHRYTHGLGPPGWDKGIA